MGYLATELLLQGKTNRIVRIKNGALCDVDITEGLQEKRNVLKLEMDVLAAMTGL